MERLDAPDVIKGVVVGLASGFAATWVMTKFQTAMSGGGGKSEAKPYEQSYRFEEKEEESHEEGAEAGGNAHGKSREETQEEQASTATAKAALKMSHAMRRREPHDLERASNAVHYGFGTLLGGGYGALVETTPMGGAICGTLYGAGIWLLADEVAVPATGLSEPPWRQEMSTHAYGLVAHLIYGLTLGIVHRLLRRIL